MPTLTDPILTTMADELRAALVALGLDPTSPPPGPMPSARVWEEYQRRGGTVYTDADTMAAALVEETGHVPSD